MVAEFKSHVLSRNEKGFLGVPFKRLLLAGVGGGICYTVGKLALPDVAIPLAFGMGLLLVILTAPRGGIPRWQRLVYQVRGGLMLSAAQSPVSLAGSIGKLVELPADLAHLDAETLFAPPAVDVEANLAEWVTFAQAADADRGDGLELVEVR
jgi:hypothetical protein